MRLNTAMMCDYVQVWDNRLYVMGGCPRFLWVRELPAKMQMGLALVLELDSYHDERAVFDAPVHRVADDAQVGGVAQFEAQRNKPEYVGGSPNYISIGATLRMEVTDVGPHVVRISNHDDGTPLGEVHFGVRVPMEQD